MEAEIVEREFTDTYVDPESQETRTRTFRPEDHALIDGVNHYFEFDGCYHHQCIHNCSTSRKSRRNKNRDDSIRNDFYRRTGILHTITECVWKKERLKQSFPIRTSVFFNEKRITESMILRKTKNGQFFGLLRLDLKSPQHVYYKFMKLRFPPFFLDMEISSEMIHEKYQDLMGARSRNAEHKVLTQAFHASNILITSETARFYHQVGIELSNLTWACEFERDTPFAPFVSQITEERKKATREGNKALGNIWKLVMNRFALF